MSNRNHENYAAVVDTIKGMRRKIPVRFFRGDSGKDALSIAQEEAQFLNEIEGWDRFVAKSSLRTSLSL